MVCMKLSSHGTRITSDNGVYGRFLMFRMNLRRNQLIQERMYSVHKPFVLRISRTVFSREHFREDVDALGGIGPIGGGILRFFRNGSTITVSLSIRNVQVSVRVKLIVRILLDVNKIMSKKKTLNETKSCTGNTRTKHVKTNHEDIHEDLMP